MTTWTTLTTLATEAQAQALAALMEELLDPAPSGIGCFEIEDDSGRWEVGGYFLAKPDEAALAVLAAMHEARPFVVSKLDDRDWVAKVQRELHPIHAGRFTVHGAHDRASVPTHRVSLMIEAAMAFGTGHHASTQGCLWLMDDLARRGWPAGQGPSRAADIGSGTGVLAIAAAKVWRARVVASDIDPIAVATTRANVAVNGVASLVQTIEATGFRHPVIRREAPYDLVLANILARPVRRMAPDMARHLRLGGYAVLSGLLTTQAPAVWASFAAHGFVRVTERRIGAWSALLLRCS
ncbi:MAG: 50S ribosomal protein L11 methyltransferase [Pseudomonadota bacterium]